MRALKLMRKSRQLREHLEYRKVRPSWSYRLFENAIPDSRRGEEADDFGHIYAAHPPPYLGGYGFQTGSQTDFRLGLLVQRIAAYGPEPGYILATSWLELRYIPARSWPGPGNIRPTTSAQLGQFLAVATQVVPGMW
jgi:hypothetical protein